MRIKAHSIFSLIRAEKMTCACSTNCKETPKEREVPAGQLTVTVTVTYVTVQSGPVWSTAVLSCGVWSELWSHGQPTYVTPPQKRLDMLGTFWLYKLPQHSIR